MGRPGNCIPRHIWGFYQKVQRGYKSFYRIYHCHRSCDVLCSPCASDSTCLIYHPLSRNSKYCHIPQLNCIANPTHPHSRPLHLCLLSPSLSLPLYTHTHVPQRQPPAHPSTAEIAPKILNPHHLNPPPPLAFPTPELPLYYHEEDRREYFYCYYYIYFHYCCLSGGGAEGPLTYGFLIASRVSKPTRA